jgi:hypothetical protein
MERAAAGGVEADGGREPWRNAGNRWPGAQAAQAARGKLADENLNHEAARTRPAAAPRKGRQPNQFEAQVGPP